MARRKKKKSSPLFILFILLIAAGYYYYNNIYNKKEISKIEKPKKETVTRYNRDDWGDWADEDNDGLNTRHEVLARESLVKPVISNNRVISGKWYDKFTGKYFTNAKDLDIDHLVPLKNAHISGASNWSKEKKSEYYNFPMRFLAKTLFACAAGVIVQTGAARDFFPPVIRKKAVILKNPLNPAFVRERRTERPDGRIVSVGRVDANKNHALILRAFARIAPEFPDTSLVIYGDGEKRRELIGKAQELGLSNRVQFPGAVSDVAEKIRTASAFVLSSGHEGMPNALIEAMCLGIPSISTDCPCGGPRELIEDGVNGYLIPVGDEEALADRLRRIFSDEEGAERMGKQAALLLEEYRPERVNAEWMDYLLGCAAR